MDKIINFPKKFLLGGIALYQWLASPWMGRCCRFYPSCSQYAKDAIVKYGAIRGAWLTIFRLLKCHPWHPGGVDELK